MKNRKCKHIDNFIYNNAKKMNNKSKLVLFILVF